LLAGPRIWGNAHLVNRPGADDKSTQEDLERALRASEASLREVFDLNPDATNVNRLADGQYVAVNESFLQMMGSTREEVLGRTSVELGIWDDLADRDRLVALLEEQGVVRDFEARFRTRFGEVIDGLMSARLMTYAGDPVILSITRDVTERKRSERRYRLLADNSLDVIWTMDLSTLRLNYVSPSIERLRGLTVEEALAEPLDESLTEESLARMGEIMARSLGPGGASFHTGIFDQPCADGSLKHVEITASYIRDASGRPVEILGVSRDATVRVEAERALRESEARFRTLIERSTDMIVLLDGAARITFWSPSATEALGWESGDLVGRDFLGLIHPDDVEGAAETVRRILAGGGSTARVAVRIQHKRGNWRSIDGPCRNLLADPAVRALVLNARDVTAQLQLEAQYRQAQKLESIGRLAGGIAHDFNNLLTVILSSSEVLKQDRDKGVAVDPEDIDQIHAAGERARDLTRQLLAFARKQVIAPTSLDLNAVVRGCEKLLHRVLGEDVRLVVNAPPDLWPVVCDAGQIEQVLLNLAVNARDAMPGGGALTVEIENVLVGDAEAARDPDQRQGSWVRIIVRDTGLGMSPEAMAHLFEPFFTTKERGKGTGLGLATVHGIVAQSGGHIHVESQPGRGTTFKICLPRSDSPHASRPPSKPSASERGSETILVVEDDVQVRGVTVRALEGKGYRVIPAASGEEALAIAQKPGERFDMVVTDVVMPGMSGREVVDELRRSRPDIPALFVSGYTQDAIAQRGVLDSGLEFLAKPFTPATLLGRVRAMLDSL
jgi:two-component system cell cycle sensor histidine kinase/response regulator CckA